VFNLERAKLNTGQAEKQNEEHHSRRQARLLISGIL